MNSNHPSRDLIVSTALVALSFTPPSVVSPLSVSSLSLQNCHLFSLNPDSPSLNSDPGFSALWLASSSVCAPLPFSWRALPACVIHSWATLSWESLALSFACSCSRASRRAQRPKLSQVAMEAPKRRAAKEFRLIQDWMVELSLSLPSNSGVTDQKRRETDVSSRVPWRK